MLVFENSNVALMAYEAGDVDFLPSMAVSYDHEIARLVRTGRRDDFHLCPVLATHLVYPDAGKDRTEQRDNNRDKDFRNSGIALIYGGFISVQVRDQSRM